MVTRTGIIGLSEGNGHPFSFSAIINGYVGSGLVEAGWAGIHDYLSRRHPADFGVGNLRVTHAWTQSEAITTALCHAASIPHGVSSPEAMLGEIDAVIIARDDAESHLHLARPFLEAGLPVFIDKPLTLNQHELQAFSPYLESGRLMSCSAMRYAVELDELRYRLNDHGRLSLVRGTVINGWEKYGIHLLEAILSLLPSRPVSVEPLSLGHESVLIRLADDTPIIIDALGDSPVIFELDVIGKKKVTHHTISDNFSMFRRALWVFSRMIETGTPGIAPDATRDTIRTLMAGSQALREGRKCYLDAL
ncbi:hypothetical protein E0702_15295 [Halomonas marinisediminis]|uniref:Gfo/Idh/MocA-like oxidoreductase N-terminal domain-containing protein n=1 Tax=Halomonas marinisediminis TaxID=2546095 RepID=A0ABY2D830_9GAMM|nr:hypothetical protein E0702_15295 [Halomonas marinisediminis]